MEFYLCNQQDVLTDKSNLAKIQRISLVICFSKYYISLQNKNSSWLIQIDRNMLQRRSKETYIRKLRTKRVSLYLV